MPNELNLHRLFRPVHLSYAGLDRGGARRVRISKSSAWSCTGNKSRRKGARILPAVLEEGTVRRLFSLRSFGLSQRGFRQADPLRLEIPSRPLSRGHGMRSRLGVCNHVAREFGFEPLETLQKPFAFKVPCLTGQNIKAMKRG